MKSVDVTLLIQACNFFIAYIILRKFVFEPACHILDQEEGQDKNLQASIDQASWQKNRTGASIKQRLLEIKQLLHTIIPSLDFSSLLDQKTGHQSVAPEPMVLSKKECQKIQTIISEKVSKVTL